MENSGIFNINKPLHMTSHDVVSIVRKKMHERRVGHAGTLDPLASGVLIVLVGKEATKRQNEFMGLPKEYVAEVTLGSVSETYDAQGPVSQTATLEQLQALTETDVRAALPQFIGTIQQRPPAHSAIKVGGQPMYKKARAGKIIVEDIPFRTVTIDEIELIAFIPAIPPFPPTLRIRIACQKGVYIRSLASDLGQALGVGAYLSELVRTKIGSFTVEDAIELDHLSQK